MHLLHDARAHFDRLTRHHGLWVPPPRLTLYEGQERWSSDDWWRWAHGKLGDVYALHFPSWGGGSGASEAVGVVLSTTCAGTAITANATPGNDGAWTQLIASTARQYDAILVACHYGGGVAGNLIAEFGQGAGGSEQKLMTFHNSARASNQRSSWSQCFLPLAIPGSTRIAARVRRSVTASAVTRVFLIGLQEPSRYLPPFHRITDYGVSLANSRGTTVDPGATAGTQGTKTSVDAATANPIYLLYVQANRETEAAATVNGAGTIQFFLGNTSNALTPEFPTWSYNATDDHFIAGGPIGPFHVNQPSGIDLRAAARNQNNTAGERESTVIAWGLD